MSANSLWISRCLLEAYLHEKGCHFARNEQPEYIQMDLVQFSGYLCMGVFICVLFWEALFLLLTQIFLDWCKRWGSPLWIGPLVVQNRCFRMCWVAVGSASAPTTTKYMLRSYTARIVVIINW